MTRIPGATVIARRHLTEFVRASIAETGMFSRFASQHAKATMYGRGPVHVIDALGGTIVVRHYRRGGAVGPLLNDLYLRGGEPRPVRELWLSVYARSVGIRTPSVVVAVVYPAGIFYRADLATVLVPDSLTLADATFGPKRMADADRAIAWNATGQLIRKAATAGLIHADLNMRNILIARRDGRLVPHLLDLDRCSIVRRTTLKDLNRMTARLRRSAARLNTEGVELGADLAALDEGADA